MELRELGILHQGKELLPEHNALVSAMDAEMQQKILGLVAQHMPQIVEEMDAQSLQRIRYMSLENLASYKTFNHKLRFIPYHASKDDAFLRKVAHGVSNIVHDVLSRLETPPAPDLMEKLSHNLNNKIIATIRENYEVINQNYNPYDRFYPENGRILKTYPRDVPDLTMKSTVEKARAITLAHADTFVDTLSSEQQLLFEDIIGRLQKGHLVSQQEVYATAEIFSGWDVQMVDDFKKKFRRFAENCNRELLVYSRVFPDYLVKGAPEELTARWLDYVEYYAVSLEKIPQEFQQLQIELNLERRHLDFTVDSSLRTALPIDLLAMMMANKTNHQKSFFAQYILIKTFEHLIFDQHEIRNAITRLHAQMDFESLFAKIPAEDPQSTSWVYWNNPSLPFGQKNKQEGFIMTDSPPPEGYYFAGHEDTNMSGNTDISKVDQEAHKHVLYRLDWRYLKVNGEHVYYKGKPIRVHIVGRGKKEDEAFLHKMTKYETIEDIYDATRSRMVFDFTIHEMLHGQDTETQQPLLALMHEISNRLGTRVMGMEPALDKKKEHMDCGEFTIENGLELDPAKENKASSLLWQDMKICGISDGAATAEAQFMSFETYLRQLDPNSVTYYGTYARDRMVRAALEELPSSVLPELHAVGREILEALKKYKDARTTEELAKLHNNI